MSLYYSSHSKSSFASEARETAVATPGRVPSTSGAISDALTTLPFFNLGFSTASFTFLFLIGP